MLNPDDLEDLRDQLKQIPGYETCRDLGFEFSKSVIQLTAENPRAGSAVFSGVIGSTLMGVKELVGDPALSTCLQNVVHAVRVVMDDDHPLHKRNQSDSSHF